MELEKEYRTKEAAKILGVSVRTFYNWVQKGYLHAYQKVKTNDGRGCPLYIKESELKRFMEGAMNENRT